MQKKRLDIEKLYDTYAKKLYFTSLRITADSFDAEEAMHDTFRAFTSCLTRSRSKR